MTEDVRVTAARWLFNHDQHFKTLPPPNDFSVYAKALLCCANADHQLAPAEREWVLGYFACLGAPPEFIDQLRNYPAEDDVLELIAKSPVVAEQGSRRSLLFDAIRASSADGTFHEKERAAVERLAAKLGVSTDEVRALEQAYVDEERATAARIKLLFPQGTPF
jgi:Tellurite resistance protein TerB